MSNPRLHHYVPACYLKHFAHPIDRYDGRLYVYDRVAGRVFPSNPDKSARERDFYNIEHQHPALVEHIYAELEKRFAPVLAEVNERGMLPTESLVGRELLAFIANQASRTPRTRELVRCMFNEAQLIALQSRTDGKEAFAKKLKDWCPQVTDAETEQCFDTRGKFVDDMQARGGVADQTTLVVEALKLAEEMEAVLADRYWILGVAPNGAQFITSDEPVRLQPARRACLADPRWWPRLDDPDTDVMIALNPRLILIGRSLADHRARRRFDRRQVAGINTHIAFSARRFIYSTAPTFAYLASDGSVVEGPTDELRHREENEEKELHGSIDLHTETLRRR